MCVAGFDLKTLENLFLWSDYLGLHVNVVLVFEELAY